MCVAYYVCVYHVRMSDPICTSHFFILTYLFLSLIIIIPFIVAVWTDRWTDGQK
jgi:hypothetical protein